MLPLSSVAKTEKNKLTTDSVWLIMLEITIPSLTEVIRIVSNNEDISWNGETWQKFPFELDEISESSTAETSQFSIKVGNANNVIGQYIRQYEAWLKLNSYKAITCTLYVVNSKDLQNTEPTYSTNLILSSSSLNMIEATFTVSARDMFRFRIPLYNMYPNSCRFTLKDSRCKYSGVATTCNKSLANCKTLNNEANYGGFPTISNASVSI